MNKLIKVIFGLLVIFSFIGIASAAVGGIGDTWWSSPSEIRTYIPPNHKYTEKGENQIGQYELKIQRLSHSHAVFPFGFLKA